MALNPSKVLKHIELMLGATHQILEFDADDIMNIIFEKSLPTFSIYYPYFCEHTVKYKECEVKNRAGRYYLKTNLEIIGVSKLLTNNAYNVSGSHIAGLLSGDPVTRQIEADMASMYYQPTTFEFHAPNMIEIFPKSSWYADFFVELKCVHPNHMMTIPVALRDEFLDLCLYDVRMALYPIRHRYQNINTTFGSIEMFMEKLDSAEEDRKELISRWRENFFKSSKRRKIFVY